MDGGGGDKSQGKPPCKNFQQTGKCKFGDRCHFSHDASGGNGGNGGNVGMKTWTPNNPGTDAAATDNKAQDKKPCKNFHRTGKCKFGDRCRFSHDGSSSGGGGGGARVQFPSSSSIESVHEFDQRLPANTHLSGQRGRVGNGRASNNQNHNGFQKWF